MLHLSDYDYVLPNELIAQYPLEKRSASRLLCVNSKQLSDQTFSHFINLINESDLLVFNNTKVMKARLYGKKATGGKVEVLIERLLDQNQAIAHIKASKALKEGALIYLENGEYLKVEGREGDLFKISYQQDLMDLMAESGHLPLPPYITRDDNQQDQSRYQTVYAKHQGAIAAPTAGLHFDQELLAQLAEKNITMGHLTLHVGAGTFQPVRVENLDQHQMHAEWVEVDDLLVEQVKQCRQRGGRVIAIGTTSVRGLESASQQGEIKAYTGDTRLFIRPGYQFKSVDAMLTNFHLPKSTLLMLVSAFAGFDTIFNAYQQAINKKYRFFSYGDAMFLEKSTHY